MNAIGIAKEMFEGGLRARDCETWDRIKKYDEKLKNEILENLYEIEVQYLNKQGK